jgi:hypothetical protein
MTVYVLLDGFSMVFPSKVRDSHGFSTIFPTIFHAFAMQATNSHRPHQAYRCCVLLFSKVLIYLGMFKLEMQCHAKEVHIRWVCVCTEGLCMCFCSVQLAMKSHEHIIVIHCLVRMFVCSDLSEKWSKMWPLHDVTLAWYNRLHVPWICQWFNHVQSYNQFQWVSNTAVLCGSRF